MPQDFDPNDAETQYTTNRSGGTPNSIDSDNAPGTLITGAGAPEEEVSGEDLLIMIDVRQQELRDRGVNRFDMTAEGVELRILDAQEYALKYGGSRESFVGYINENRNNGLMGYFIPLPEFGTMEPARQQMMMAQAEGRFYNHARGTPADVLAGMAESAGVPSWATDLAQIIIVKGRRPPRRGGTDRTEGRGNDRRNPCRNRR